MASRIRKANTFAVITLMDMKSKERSFRLWKSMHFNFNDYAIVTLKKPHCTMQLGMFITSANPYKSFRTSFLLHSLTS